MKNSIIPTSELVILGEIFLKIDELVENHMYTSISLEAIRKSTDAEQVHIAVYLDFMKDFLEDASALRSLLVTSEEDFIKGITDDGERSLSDAKREIMMSGLMKMLAETINKQWLSIVTEHTTVVVCSTECLTLIPTIKRVKGELTNEIKTSQKECYQV